MNDMNSIDERLGRLADRVRVSPGDYDKVVARGRTRARRRRIANGVAGAIVAVAAVGGVTMWVQRDTGETVSAVGDADGVSTTIGSIDPSTGDFVAAGAPLEFEVVDAEGLARLVRNVVVLDDGTQFGVSTSTASREFEFAGNSVWRRASAVVVAATPATTGTRPAAASITTSTMRRFWSWVR